MACPKTVDNLSRYQAENFLSCGGFRYLRYSNDSLGTYYELLDGSLVYHNCYGIRDVKGTVRGMFKGWSYLKDTWSVSFDPFI